MLQKNTLYHFLYLSNIVDFLTENGWPDMLCIVDHENIIFLENTAFGVIERVVPTDKKLLDDSILTNLKVGSVVVHDSARIVDLEHWTRYGFKVVSNTDFGKNNRDYVAKIKTTRKQVKGDFEVYAFLDILPEQRHLVKNDHVKFRVENDAVYCFHEDFGNFYRMGDLKKSLNDNLIRKLQDSKFPVVMSSIGKRKGGERYQTLIIRVQPEFSVFF